MGVVYSADLSAATLLTTKGANRVFIPEPVRNSIQVSLDEKDSERAELSVRSLQEARSTVRRLELQLQSLPPRKRTVEGMLTQLAMMLNFGDLSCDQYLQIIRESELAVAQEYSDRDKKVADQRVERMMNQPEYLIPEVLGWQSLIEHRQSRQLDVRENAIEETYEALYVLANRKFLITVCRTGKPVVLPVGKTVKTCAEAQLWLSGDQIQSNPGAVLPRFFSIART